MESDPQTPESKSIQFPENYRDDPPSVPVGLFVQEALDLYKWCSNDKEELIHAGLDWSVVEEIPVRAEVLSAIQSEWTEFRNTPNNFRKEWRVALPEALNLRSELIHNFRHAFHAEPRELAKVKRIVKGETNAAISMSLYSLGVLGIRNSAMLEKIHMDMGMLEQAKQKSDALSSLQAQVTNSKYNLIVKRTIRNQAFWHLKEAVDEVRRVGQFVFNKDNDKHKGYVSLYKKNKRQRQLKTTQDLNKK